MAWGNRLSLSIFGESHGPAIGAVLEGLPAGEGINMEQVLVQMARRAPGHDLSATPRKESDAPRILSGMLNGKTTGSPLCAVIANTNALSSDYDGFCTVPRPGHADYTAYLRYRGLSDARGGGHFSGRLTAPLVFMGAVCRQILKRRGVTVGSHVLSVHGAADTPFDPVNVSADLLDDLSSRYFPTVDPLAESAMRAEIESWNVPPSGYRAGSAVRSPRALNPRFRRCCSPSPPARAWNSAQASMRRNCLAAKTTIRSFTTAEP